MQKLCSRRPKTYVHAIRLIVFLVLLLPSGATADEAEGNASARAYNGAAALQNAGLHQRAEKKWLAFIAAHPQDDRIEQAHYFLGMCQLRSQRFPEAVATLTKVLQTWPNHPQADAAHYNLAIAKYEQATRSENQDLLRQSTSDFSKVVEKYPDSDWADDALYFQGDSLFGLGDVQAAIPIYERLIRRYPTSGWLARAHYDLGIAQQKLAQIDDAAKTFESFLAKPEFASDELTPEIRLRLAICLQQLDRLDEAAKEFDTVSQRSEFELAPLARLRFAQVKMQQRKWDEAARAFSELPAKFPKTEFKSEALKSAGHCYFLLDQFQKAEQILQGVASGKEPVAAEALFWLGKSQLKLDRHDQALHTFESAVGRFPNSPLLPDIKTARVDTLYEIPERRGETISLYESFLAEHPEHPLAAHAKFMAAQASLDQSQFAKARQHGQEFLAKHPADKALVPGATYVVAESLLLENPDSQENRSKALSLYRDLVANYPDHPLQGQSWIRIGWCLLADGQEEAAIGVLGKAMGRLDPLQQVPEAQMIIGQSHASLARHREAITAFDAALAANRKWPRGDEVLLATAESHHASGETDAAIGRLRKLVDEFAKSELRPAAIYRLGEFAQQNDKTVEAVNWFSRLIREHADSELVGPAMHSLATARFAQRNYRDAISWADRLTQAANIDSGLQRRGRFVRGLARQRLGEIAQAIDDLSGYLKEPALDSEVAPAWQALALCYIAQKDFANAQTALGKLLAADPEFGNADETYYELGHALLLENDKAGEAADAFGTLGEKWPDSELAAESWFRVGQYHQQIAQNASGSDEKQQEWSAAETALGNALAAVKEKGLREKTQYTLGDIQVQRGRYAEATQTLTDQIAEFEQGDYVAPAKFLIAECRLRQNQIEPALQLFTEIVDAKFPPGDAKKIEQYRVAALYRAGDCAAKLKRWPESERHFRQVVDQYADFPQRADAAYGFAFALQQQGKVDDAIAAYERITAQTETEIAAKSRFMIGEIAFGQKRYEDAIEHFLLVTVGYPYPSWQGLASFETARCFAELGNVEKATATLKEMIENHPQHPRVADAKKMLAEQ